MYQRQRGRVYLKNEKIQVGDSLRINTIWTRVEKYAGIVFSVLSTLIEVLYMVPFRSHFQDYPPTIEVGTIEKRQTIIKVIEQKFILKKRKKILRSLVIEVMFSLNNLNMLKIDHHNTFSKEIASIFFKEKEKVIKYNF